MSNETSGVFLNFHCWYTQSFCFRRESCPCWMALEGGCINTCKIKNMYQPPWDNLSGNCFVQTNCTKQLVFPIPVLVSLNIQINMMTNIRIFWGCEIEILYWWYYWFLSFAVFVTFEKSKLCARLCQFK